MTKYKIRLNGTLKKNRHSYKFESILRRILKIAREQNLSVLCTKDKEYAYLYVGENICR